MVYDNSMDKECVGICDAINSIPGLRTVESCSGHGDREFRVWFVAEGLEHLPILLYYCDPCHVGFRWHCSVACATSPVTFLLKSESEGGKAYDEAQVIANEVAAYLREKR